MGLGPAVAAQLVVAAQPVFNLRQLRAGNHARNRAFDRWGIARSALPD